MTENPRVAIVCKNCNHVDNHCDPFEHPILPQSECEECGHDVFEEEIHLNFEEV